MIQNHLSPLLSLFTQVAQFQVSTGGSLLMSRVAHFLVDILNITGPQWELARKLYNENNGDKYKIYIVKNAGTENAKIEILENPTKLWKDGKLYAHPVRFRL